MTRRGTQTRRWRSRLTRTGDADKGGKTVDSAGGGGGDGSGDAPS